MPTLAELRNGVYSDLADENAPHVFSQLQVEDFIRGGIADLNRVTPVDTIEDIAFVTDPDSGLITKFDYDTGIELPYRVEWRLFSDGSTGAVDEAVEGQSESTGYIFRRTSQGGHITFPQWWLVGMDPSLYGIRLHGYGARPLPPSVDETTVPSPVVDLSDQEVYSVRSYSKAAGFDLLAHDRSMFAQWQGQTNNTDVSPTQIMQMTANAKSDWNHQRGLIRTIRRYW